MKGLLIKDLYVLIKYCKIYLFIVALITVLAFVNSTTNLFILLYPCAFCGMIPITLISYDKAFRWNEYCMTLPYTKWQIVSAKYILAISSQLTALILTAIGYAFSLKINGFFEIKSFAFIMMAVLGSSLLTSSVSLPLIFRFGAEKGRMILYGIVGVTIFICSVGNNMLYHGIHLDDQDFLKVIAVFCAIVIMYALSWAISVKMYEKHEIK